jgi:hypothetical protein
MGKDGMALAKTAEGNDNRSKVDFKKIYYI